MARDRSSIVKQSRREGFALHPKAHKYLVKKTSLPGQQGRHRRRVNNQNNQYLIQLREKQKVRRLYGLLEKQFSNLFKKAIEKHSRAGEEALFLLEKRLDNAVYRSGLAISRRGARQLVSHKHLKLNGRRVNIASITLKTGDQIVVHTKSQKNNYFKHLQDLSPPIESPPWLEVDRQKLVFSVRDEPRREDIPEAINEQLLVEYYSR